MTSGQQQDRVAVDPERGEDGRLRPGGGSLNPGGQPKWVKEVRDSLRSRCLPLAEKHLYRVLNGDEEAASLKDKSEAARIVLEYTVPKPKAQVRVKHSGTIAPLAGLTHEQLTALASVETDE